MHVFMNVLHVIIITVIIITYHCSFLTIPSSPPYLWICNLWFSFQQCILINFLWEIFSGSSMCSFHLTHTRYVTVCLPAIVWTSHKIRYFLCSLCTHAFQKWDAWCYLHMWREGRILVVHNVLKGCTYVFIRFHGLIGLIRRICTS
jgi:hypothetical protein